MQFLIYFICFSETLSLPDDIITYHMPKSPCVIWIKKLLASGIFTYGWCQTVCQMEIVTCYARCTPLVNRFIHAKFICFSRCLNFQKGFYLFLETSHTLHIHTWTVISRAVKNWIRTQHRRRNGKSEFLGFYAPIDFLQKKNVFKSSN